MPDFLFDCIPQVFKRIHESDHVVVFLDYDGTLVPFKEKPDDVVTPNGVKTVLTKLINNKKCTVVIVSGRTLKEIKKLLNIPGLSYAAVHGLQIEFSDGTVSNWKPAEHIQALIKTIKKNLIPILQEEKKIILEDKELTLAFHYRQVPENRIKDIKEKFLDIVKKYDTKNSLEILHGAKVIEVRPHGWNKGKAVETFLNNFIKQANTLSIYIGDDVTDEDAFRCIGELGITIFVSNNAKRKTNAQYWVKNPGDVSVFLESLYEKMNQVFFPVDTKL
jgi:trehalose 6-phosphate phosphatase